MISSGESRRNIVHFLPFFSFCRIAPNPFLPHGVKKSNRKFLSHNWKYTNNSFSKIKTSVESQRNIVLFRSNLPFSGIPTPTAPLTRKWLIENIYLIVGNTIISRFQEWYRRMKVDEISFFFDQICCFAGFPPPPYCPFGGKIVLFRSDKGLL